MDPNRRFAHRKRAIVEPVLGVVAELAKFDSYETGVYADVHLEPSILSSPLPNGVEHTAMKVLKPVER